MDETLRMLLGNAVNRDDQEGQKYLEDAYTKLKRSQESSDQPTPFGAEAYVLCAETAYQAGQLEIAEDCLQMFFKRTGVNEFLGRAFLCQAQLNKPTSANQTEELEKAASFLLKAINFAKSNPRHQYLVYNSSVLYWSFARPFLKPGCKSGLAKTLHQIVKSLDDIEDKDYEWRAQLMLSLIECYLDGGKKEDAAHVSTAAASFSKAYCPPMYKMVLALQVQHKLVDLSKLLKDSKVTNDVAIYFRILKLRSQIESGEKLDIDIELDRVFKLIVSDGNDPPGTGRSTRMSQMSSVGPIPFTERLPLIVDLARLGLDYERIQLVEDCLAYTVGSVKEPALSLDIEFLKSELLVHKLKEKKYNYTKAVVETRLRAIKSLEENITAAIRLKNPNLIQTGCITLWNFCLPLLQKDLRKTVKEPITLISDALEDIDSLLILLRCQIHMELAKCEEDQEQLEYAMGHLRKALELDDTGAFKSRIEASLQRLQLRSMLYQIPDRSEDVAALIVEQARSTSETGNAQMKRASLVKAGLALASDAFGLVMDGESFLQTAKNIPSNPKHHAEKALRYNKSMGKAAGHLKRLGSENDKERVQIWADLVKTARKQNVWDVVRVAGKFCLLYDDGRWDRSLREPSAKAESKAAPQSAVPTNTTTDIQNVEGRKSVDENRDMMRILAEVNFIYAEALIQLLQTEGVKLLEAPTALEDTSMKPKSREGKSIRMEDTSEWKTYSDWISSLSEDAIKGFQRGAKIGVDLGAPWIVCNAGIYLWNFLNHVLESDDCQKIVSIFQPIYDSMKTVGYTGEALFFCELCHALARGYMQNHLPSSIEPGPVMGTEKDKKSKHGKQSGSPAFMKSRSFVGITDTDALNELKLALEILEYALNVTSGADIRNIVPIAVRHPLIKSWVLCKILTGQQLPKTLGHEEESPHSQGPMSKSLCALEALTLQISSGCEIANCPGLTETIKLAESCKWSDRLIEIETWTRLAYLSFTSSNHETVYYCCERALELGKARKIIRFDKLNDSMKHKYKVEQEMLYYACVLMGQSLVSNMHGRNKIRNRAMGYFIDACKFATTAQNYTLAMTAARHYWNTCQHSISSPIERKLLKDPLTIVLKCLAEVSKYSEFKEIIEKNEDSEEKGNQVEKKSALKKSPPKAKKDKNKKKQEAIKSSRDSTRVRITGQEADQAIDKSTSQSRMDADLTLRAALYGVLFQACIDMGQWKEGLDAMDEAIRVMPRTQHRMLIFKHRVIVNARLGKPVQFDMGKFKDADESLLSSMWRRVARNSGDPRDQLIAYQNAIECLQAVGTDWQKVEYLTEFGEWLFVNEFPVEDCLDQFHLAINIVLEGIKSKYLFAPTSAKQKTPARDENKPSDIKSLLDDCFDVKSIETLARLHIMVAEMLEGVSSQSLEYALTAACCIQKLWQNAIRNAEKAVRDGVKPGERPFSKTESKKRDVNKVDRGISKTSHPHSLEQWATFSLSEKLKDHFSSDTYGYFVSKKSITKPELTVHYLEVLQEKLRNQGYDQLCLPVCALVVHISTDILMDKFSVFLAKMQMLDLVNDLQMVNASSSIQKSLAVQFLTEEDKAISREEIQIWKEKRAQAKTEEENMKKTSKAALVSAPKEMELIEFCKNKTLIRAVCKREVWTKMAALLIKQAQYQAARELLEEAKKSALTFNDKRLLATIAYNYALIAFHENDWGKVISCLEQIETLEGTLSFWLKVILLKVDAYSFSLGAPTTFHCHPEVQGGDKAIATLNGALDLLENLREVSPNKSSLANYMSAVIESRLAQYLMQNKKQIDEKQMLRVSKLLASSLDAFTKLFYPRDALRVVKAQQLLLKTQFLESVQPNRKALLVECLHVARKGVSLSKETFAKVKDVSGRNDIANLCMRVEWEMLASMLNAVEVVIDILKEMTCDVKRKAELLARKDSLHKMVEEFVSVTPILSVEDQQWKDVTNTAAEEALVMLTYLHSNCERFPNIQAKASLYLGKCLHQIALQIFPDLQEYVQDFKLKDISSSKSEIELKTEDGSRDDVLQNSQTELDDETEDKLQVQQSGLELMNQLMKKKEKSDPIKRKYAEYIMYITQSVECLMQATQIGLRNGLNDVIAESCHCFVECVGNKDTSATCQFLALYQSAVASDALNQISQRSFLDPHVSRISGLTQQRKALADSISNELLGASSLNSELLQTESEAYRRLHISRNHMEILKEIPFHITFVILQHSPDKSRLYGAVMEKQRLGLQTSKKKDITSGASNRSFISCTKVSEDLLKNLLKMSDDFKADVCSLLTRKSYIQQQKEKRKEMLGLIERCGDTTSKESVSQQLDLEIEEKRLQSRFEDLLAAIEGYFGSIIGQLEDSLKQEPAADTVVLLADEHILQLPLEALAVFRQPEIKSISRDFSLQMFYHRFLQGEITDNSDSKNEKLKTGKKDKLDPKAAKSDKALVSNTNKKAKTSKEFSVGRDGILLDIANLRYITDPTCEWPVEDENSPCNVISDIVMQLKNKAAKWNGLKGQDHMPSVAELQKFIQESPSLVFYGFENFLSHLPPQFLAPLCLTDCHLIIIMDLMKTLKGSLLQGRRDALKSPADYILERPLQTAALLSLSGAPCVVMNQWQCNVVNNRERLTSLLEGLCEASSTVGQSLKSSRDCSRGAKNAQRLVQDDVDTASEKAFASNASQKGKDGKASKLNHRTSNAGSVRSFKISSPTSLDQSKSEGKQKLEKILKEKTERKLSVDQEQASRSRAVTMEAENENKIHLYECFNTVLYGLPNFTTSLQG